MCSQNYLVTIDLENNMRRLLIIVLLFAGLANTIFISAQGPNIKHLTFDGIPLDGSYQMFKKKLLAKGYKYVKENEETSMPCVWGKPAGFLDKEVGLFIRYNRDKSQTVGGVTAVLYDFDKYDYEMIGNYHERTNKGATAVETVYRYDELPDFGRIDKEKIITIPGKGTITVTKGADMDDVESVTVAFEDAVNVRNLYDEDDECDPSRSTSESLTPYVSCASNCVIADVDCNTLISGVYNGRKFRIQPKDEDGQIIYKLMRYNNNQEVKSTLLNTYVYSVVRDNLPENTVVVTMKRMEKVIYAYVDAQRRAREQQKPTVRGVLWGMLKDYLYTPKEKAQMDRMIPKQVQEKMFQGIFGAVGGSGPTNFDMLSPAQQAVIHQSSNGR